LIHAGDLLLACRLWPGPGSAEGAAPLAGEDGGPVCCLLRGLLAFRKLPVAAIVLALGSIRSRTRMLFADDRDLACLAPLR
jgi:hypothetical protein